MKKKLIYSIIALVFIAGIAVTAVLLLRKKPERKPRTGLHFIEARGSLFVEEGEDVTIPLLTYYYNGTKKKDAEVIGKYKEFALLTDRGEAIPFEVPDEVLSGFRYGDDKRIKQTNIPITIQYDRVKNEPLVITGLRYCNEKGKIKEEDLGRIAITTQPDAYDKVGMSGLKIDWVYFMLPMMEYYEVYIDNRTEEEITLTKIDFGEPNLTTESVERTVPPKTMREVGVDVKELSQEDPFVYYVKPIAQITVGDEVKTVVQSNITTLRYIGDGKMVYEYFLNKQ